MLAYPAAERERRGQRHSSDAAFPGQVAAQNLAHRVKPGYGLFVAVEHMERGIDLQPRETAHGIAGDRQGIEGRLRDGQGHVAAAQPVPTGFRSEEDTSELQPLMHLSYAIVCLKK